MKERGVDLTLITSPANILYLTRFHCDPHERLLSLIIPAEEQPFLIAPRMEVQRAKDAGWKGEILGYDDAEDPWKRIREKLDRLNELYRIETERYLSLAVSMGSPSSASTTGSSTSTKAASRARWRCSLPRRASPT